MLSGQDVGEEGCFACDNFLISTSNFVILTWAQLACYDSDRNLEHTHGWKLELLERNKIKEEPS